MLPSRVISEASFIFVYVREFTSIVISSELYVPPRDYQLRHLAVIPLHICGVTSHCECDKLSQRKNPFASSD